MKKKSLTWLTSLSVVAAVTGFAGSALAAPPDIAPGTGTIDTFGEITLSGSLSSVSFNFLGEDDVLLADGVFTPFLGSTVTYADFTTGTSAPSPFITLPSGGDDFFTASSIGAPQFVETGSGVTITVPVEGTFNGPLISGVPGNGLFTTQFSGVTVAELIPLLSSGTLTTESASFEIVPGPAILPASIIGGAFLNKIKSRKKKEQEG